MGLDFRENARFVRIYGNENASTIHLARDRLAVKTTPTFFVFKDGELMHSHSGANVDKFDDAVKEQIGELEEGTYEQNWARGHARPFKSADNSNTNNIKTLYYNK